MLCCFRGSQDKYKCQECNECVKPTMQYCPDCGGLTGCDPDDPGAFPRKKEETDNIENVAAETSTLSVEDWMNTAAVKSALTEAAKMIQNRGKSAAGDDINTTLNAWKHSPIKIAVIGESGTGKSSLINALLGLTANQDRGAEVGTTETTMKIKNYPHPKHSNLELWDIPGVGTPNFPKNTYLKTIEFEKFDFFILTCASRFKENDAWLANAILSINKRFYFVRTKVDNDITNDRRANAKSHAPNKVLEKIKEDCITQLQKANVTDPQVFLVNSFEPKKFDFNRLLSKLISDAPDMKKESLLLSMSAISGEILNEKRRVLESRIYKMALVSSLASAIPIPGTGIAVDFVLMRNETELYKQQLGLDDETLANIAKGNGISLDKLKMSLEMQSSLIFRSQVAFVNFCAGIIVK